MKADTSAAAPVGADPAFESAWLMLAWARMHAERLQAEIVAVATGPEELRPAIQVEANYQPRRHGFVIKVQSVSPQPPTWGLMLADFANCVRSSLDHVAWAVVGRGTRGGSLTPGQQASVYFPIEYKRAEFNSRLDRKLPGALRADVATIRRVQPYLWRQKIIAQHPLSILDALVKENKHRTISPPFIMPVAEVNYVVTRESDCTLTGFRTAKNPPLRAGAEIGLAAARRTGPDPDIEVQFHTSLTPCVNEALPIAMQTWIQHILIMVEVVLQVFSPPPDSARELVGGLSAAGRR